MPDAQKPASSDNSPMSIKRLMSDFKKLQQQNLVGVNARPDGTNLYHWEAVIFGPENTPYEDGTFHMTMDFTPTYPMAPPIVRFDPPIFHPNVYNNGSICLDILNKAWSPTFTVGSILVSIQTLLANPNPNSPANAEAANLYNANRAEYDKRVRQEVEKSWASKLTASSSPVGPDVKKKEDES